MLVNETFSKLLATQPSNGTTSVGTDLILRLMTRVFTQSRLWHLHLLLDISGSTFQVIRTFQSCRLLACCRPYVVESNILSVI